MTWTVSDGRGGTASAELRVTVEPADPPPPPSNSAPSAVNDSFGTFTDNGSGDSWKIGPLCNDSDPDGDPFRISSVSASAGSTTIGTSSGNCRGNGADDNVFWWSPGGHFGPVTFTYTITDGTASDSATVTLCIESPINPVYCP